MDWWQHLTEGQATLISGALTLFSGILVAFVGPFILGREFKTLNKSAEQAQSAAQSVGDALGKLKEDIGKARSELSNLKKGQDELLIANWKEKLRNLWSEIQGEVDRDAESPKVAADRREFYGKIDRRKYIELIDALRHDGILTGQKADDIARAQNLWQANRSKIKAAISEQDIQEMQIIRDRIVKGRDE